MPTLLWITPLLLAFAAPWTFLLSRRSTDTTLESVLDRLCFGYAISFVALYVASQLRLWLFFPIWGAGALACVVAAARCGTARAPFSLDLPGRIVVSAAALYLALRLLPFLVRTLPLGWDAYFHMTIAESITTRGQAVHDWLPYEDMPLNYPIGSHLVQALIQTLTGQRPHVYFDLMIVWFTLLSGLQLFALTSRATQDRWVACYAALSYLFLANWGSLHYIMWSGLPNLIGMYLFLGLLSWLTREDVRLVRSTPVFVVYYLAICFVHHHVMVTAGLCLLWTACVAWFSAERTTTKRIALGLATSAVVGSPYFGMYLLRSVNLGNTKIGSYMEVALDGLGIAQKLGYGFTAAAVIGVCLWFRSRQPIATTVTQPLVAMLGLYVLVDFVIRILSHRLFNHEISPFTPSRFITDTATLFSVFAGVFFRSMHGARDAHWVPLAGCIVAGLFVFNRGTYRDSFRDTLSPAKQSMYEWIRANTTPDTVVLDMDWHATYLTQRMTSGFPLPTSEYSALAHNRKRLQRVGSGREPITAIGKRVLTVVSPGAPVPPGRQLWRGPGYRLIESFAPSGK